MGSSRAAGEGGTLSASHASGFPLATAEQLFTIGSQFTVRSDEAVERLPGNPEFLTKIAHTGFRFPNCCMRETHLGRGHLEATTAMSSSCTG